MSKRYSVYLSSEEREMFDRIRTKVSQMPELPVSENIAMRMAIRHFAEKLGVDKSPNSSKKKPKVASKSNK